MVLDKSSSKKAFAGKKVRYLSYLLAGALSREGQFLVPGHEYRIPNNYLPQFMQKRREYHGGSDLIQKLDANSLYPKSDINKYP